MTESDAIQVVVLGDEQIELPSVLPVLPVREAVVFPGMNVPLAVGRAASLAALEQAVDLAAAEASTPECV